MSNVDKTRDPEHPDTDTAMLRRRLEEQRLELTALRNQLRSIENKYDDICNSIIWRKTKWLRDTLDYLKNWRGGYFFLRDAIRNRLLSARPASSGRCYDWPAHIAAWRGKVAIVQSIFEFDPLLNQRPVNLAKYLSSQGFLVIYVAWQKSESANLKHSFRFVADNILQVPFFTFIQNVKRLDTRRNGDATLFVTFPAAALVRQFSALRSAGYAIVYDIMDDWEEFNRFGQAVWYERGVEEQAVLAADLVTVVSEPLLLKFNYLRSDIQIISNGVSPALIGLERKNCSNYSPRTDGTITVGYVGHLTDSWLDWDAVFRAAAENPLLRFEVIGYGASPETLARMAEGGSIRYHGKVPPGRLHEYVKQWHVAIIPFKDGPLARAVDPIKIYEYLYFGLPVVATGIPGVAGYPGVIFCQAAGLGDAIMAAYDGKMTGQPDAARVDAFLLERTWEHLFSFLLARLESGSSLRRLYA